MTISNELLDELLKGCKRPVSLLGNAGLVKELKLRLMERMPGAGLRRLKCSHGLCLGDQSLDWGDATPCLF